jgi:UDP-MurNAc hydroxylase
LKIEFVNHSSVIISNNDVHLIFDPWISGDVFHDGWSLITETQFKFEDFKTITHIWFSHEHPDHFFPPNLKKIPEEIRKEIIVLYHFTRDKKVINYCKSLGFKDAIEINLNEWFKLGKDFRVLNGTCLDDSWILINTANKNILNTNDCILKKRDFNIINKNILGKLDLLLPQFSYASKIGNKKDVKLRKEQANLKIKELGNLIKNFVPKFIIPIASFIWFSHEENFYMNDSINTVNDFNKKVDFGTSKPIIMKPGDSFDFQNHSTNKENLLFYEGEYNKKIKLSNVKKTKPVLKKDIIDVAYSACEKIKKKYPILSRLLNFVPLKFYSEDLNEIYVFYPSIKVEVRKYMGGTYDIKCSGEVIKYCLQFPWGFNTISVNGRFSYTNKLSRYKLSIYKIIFDSLNHNTSLLSRLFYKI